MPELLTVAEVARFLKISTASVYAKAKAGTLPTLRVGANTLRFDPDAIVTWCQAQRIPVPAAIQASGNVPAS